MHLLYKKAIQTDEQRIYPSLFPEQSHGLFTIFPVAHASIYKTGRVRRWYLKPVHSKSYCESALKFHLELSLLKSNSASVGVLSPADTSATLFFEAGTSFGMIRYVPSVS